MTTRTQRDMNSLAGSALSRRRDAAAAPVRTGTEEYLKKRAFRDHGPQFRREAI